MPQDSDHKESKSASLEPESGPKTGFHKSQLTRVLESSSAYLQEQESMSRYWHESPAYASHLNCEAESPLKKFERVWNEVGE